MREMVEIERREIRLRMRAPDIFGFDDCISADFEVVVLLIWIVHGDGPAFESEVPTRL
jgi:hypothetical protein